ncbi:MAG: hypothetical protein AAGC70_18065 [Pseudomonadota bacterium]
MLRALIAITALAIVTVGSSAITATSAEARTCIGYRISARGIISQFRVRAAASARRVWSRRTKRIVGTKFDTWLFAQGRSITCFPVGDNEKQMRCRALATPCRGPL